jgi:hypothetical protein
MTDQQPTQGQRIQLERIASIYWALVGEQLTPGAPITYHLRERGTGHTRFQIEPAMVASLLQEGWIELSGEGNVRRWGYRITLAGIRARGTGWK